MSDQVKFKKGLSTNLDSLPIENGSIIFTTDDNKLYIDDNSNRFSLVKDTGCNIITLATAGSGIGVNEIHTTSGVVLLPKTTINLTDLTSYYIDVYGIGCQIVNHSTDSDTVIICQVVLYGDENTYNLSLQGATTSDDGTFFSQHVRFFPGENTCSIIKMHKSPSSVSSYQDTIGSTLKAIRIKTSNKNAVVQQVIVQATKYK